MNRNHTNRMGGFTLIETLIAAVIMLLVALISAPFFTSRVPVYKIENSASSIAASMRLLRNEAITRNKTLSYKYVSGTKSLELYDDTLLLSTRDITDSDSANINLSFGATPGYFNGQGQFQTSAKTFNLSTLTVTVTHPQTSEKRLVRVGQNGRITISDS